MAGPVGSQNQTFEDTILPTKVLCKRLTALEGNLVGGKVQDTQTVVLEQVFRDGVDGVTREAVLL